MFYDIGVDIGGTNTKMGLVDAKGRVVVRRRFRTRAEEGPMSTLQRVARVAQEWSRQKKVRSMGVGVAGLVDHLQGIVRVPPNLPGWHGTAVKQILEDLTGLSVVCGNDANAVCLGEWLHGAGQGCADFLCVTLGTGVGAGAVVQGKLLLGANHAAAELGHTIIFGNGLRCRCGGRGCLERYVGARYLLHRARMKLRAQLKKISHRNQISFIEGTDSPSLLFAFCQDRLDRLSPEMIGRAARRRDKLALEIVEETGFYLGLGLVNAIALLDPERIAVGGGLSGLGQPLLLAARRTVFNRAQTYLGRRLQVVAAQLGSDAGIIGASRFRVLLEQG